MPEGDADKRTADSTTVAAGAAQGAPDPARAFISYASADSSIANTVCSALEREGVKCWIAPRDVTPGELYAANIVHAIDTTQVVVLVLSQHAADSAHVLREVERASSKRHPILSIRIDQAALPDGLEYFLNSSQWLDASTTGVHRALPKLIDAVRGALAKPTVAAHPSQIPLKTPSTHWRPRRMLVALYAFVAIALAYAVVDRFWLSQRLDRHKSLVEATTASQAVSSSADLPSAAQSVQKTIAVLPFADMSPARDHTYLADGISEEILHLLSESPALRVIARTSSFSFRDRNLDVSAIAKKLNVTHILEGSVRKSGQRVRVTAQLIDARTAVQVWSEAYDRDEHDFLSLQTEIAKSVASALAIAFSADGGTARAGTANAEAHELYLQGLYLWNRNGPNDVRRARDNFERAVVLDSSFATAWASIAGVYRVLISEGQVGLKDGLSKQGEAVQRALNLAPGLAAAHLRASQYYWDIADEPKSRRHLEQAVLLAPGDPQVLKTSAGIALDANDVDQAIKLQRRAVAVDPLSARSRAVLASYLMATDQMAEAKIQIANALELSPNSVDLKAELAQVLILQKQFVSAQTATLDLPDGPRRDQCLALLYYSNGKTAEADAALARLISATQGQNSFESVELYAAEVYAHRGTNSEAYEWLERAKRQAMDGRSVEPGWSVRMQMRLSPFLKRLHADNRWQELVGNPWKS